MHGKGFGMFRMARIWKSKFMYWKSQSWPFHVRLKVVQCIMEPMILYYLPLFAMDKEGFAFYLATSSIFGVEEEG